MKKLKFPSIEVDTFKEKLIREHLFPSIMVYEDPKDYPGKFAARLFDVNQPTPYLVVRDTLFEVRDEIPDFMRWKSRHKKDDPVILEWYL